MKKAKFLQNDKITFQIGDEEITVLSWTDLEIQTNSLIVINNMMYCTEDITKLNENYYKVRCSYQDALIVSGDYYMGKQSELD